MAFIASYSYKGLPPVDAYFRLDHVHGGKDQGWTGYFKIYASRDARLESLEDTLSGFSKYTPYVPGDDPYSILYEAAKSDYEGSEDA